MTWHTQPFYGWDTETTSADPTECRLVTSTLVCVDESGIKDAREWLINPGVDIPADATAVHGITSEHARAAGDDAAVACFQIAKALYDAWEQGGPVVVYNASFDFTVLDRELRRYYDVPFEIRGPIIDPFVIDKHLDRYRKGKRTLTATCAHYNVRLEDAHSSTGDALAACRLAWRLASLYPELHDLSAVNGLQAEWRAAWAVSFTDFLRSQGKDETVDGAWPMRAAS